MTVLTTSVTKFAWENYTRFQMTLIFKLHRFVKESPRIWSKRISLSLDFVNLAERFRHLLPGLIDLATLIDWIFIKMGKFSLYTCNASAIKCSQTECKMQMFCWRPPLLDENLRKTPVIYSTNEAVSSLADLKIRLDLHHSIFEQRNEQTINVSQLFYVLSRPLLLMMLQKIKI